MPLLIRVDILTESHALQRQRPLSSPTDSRCGAYMCCAQHVFQNRLGPLPGKTA
ncbi:hypothetical protein BO86DRAFT_385403 [Aspergillus japonicus CBS 114.51]|uniref:Uncharacterized protein n=1 Tax=Aspergillus japonicus CBS 114.51 TaxID=1448312 RepID=A0A8T8XGV8_ASPJA|nr:hypothetical protein BO86DRAFT_385403 [Aspergillus japonicus CBS 114.51]RAH86562.1 hypothetical protein BO86DRAFT_385403 [Aspergillus japonicus CBS 114.51]